MVSVIQVHKASVYLGGSSQSHYISRYLQHMGCRTLVVEDGYIDKDHIIDYSNFYARSFKNIARTVDRLHFFTGSFTEEEFLAALEQNKIASVCGSYLGFSIIKPVQDVDGNWVIGRTLLETYEKEDPETGATRHYILDDYTVNLYGHEFKIRSLPFQAQDSVLGACATVALWTAGHALNKAFGTQIEPPSNITKLSTRYYSLGGCFPSEGLDLAQMIGYIQSIGLDVDLINISEFNENAHSYVTIPEPNGLVAAKMAIRAYQNVEIPPIAMIAILDKETRVWDLHAAVVSGYRSDAKGEIDEIYLHDDGIGPYCQTKFIKLNKTVKTKNADGSINEVEVEVDRLKNQWVDGHLPYELAEADELVLLKLIVPRYPKIRLTISRVIPTYYDILKDIGESAGETENVDIQILLYRVQDYKKEIIGNPFVKDKLDTLLCEMPKFLFVFRQMNGGKIFGDLVYDATDSFARKAIFANFYKVR